MVRWQVMAPVWFTGNQLPPTVTKRIHKVKAKKDVNLNDANFAEDYRTKKTASKKIITVSPSSKSNNSNITKLNLKFYEGDKENKNVHMPENNNSNDTKSELEVSNFFTSEDSCDQ